MVVFTANDFVFQDDILNQIDFLSDFLPVISFADLEIFEFRKFFLADLFSIKIEAYTKMKCVGVCVGVCLIFSFRVFFVEN